MVEIIVTRYFLCGIIANKFCYKFLSTISLPSMKVLLWSVEGYSRGNLAAHGIYPAKGRLRLGLRLGLGLGVGVGPYILSRGGVFARLESVLQ